MSAELTPALPLTFAARRSGEVHLQLQLPALGRQLPAGSRLRLERGGRKVEAAARSVPCAAGTLLISSVPGTDLTTGTWRLRLREGHDEPWRKLHAFMLLPPVGPVSLLLGTPTPSRLVAVGRVPRRRRVAEVAGRGLDRALAPLGPRRARVVRDRVRHVARRLLP